MRLFAQADSHFWAGGQEGPLRLPEVWVESRDREFGEQNLSNEQEDVMTLFEFSDWRSVTESGVDNGTFRPVLSGFSTTNDRRCDERL